MKNHTLKLISNYFLVFIKTAGDCINSEKATPHQIALEM
jgi:hypothetical protein